MNTSQTEDMLIVKESDLHGRGLFSTTTIAFGQIITQIQGEIINGNECVKREFEGNVYIFWKDDDTFIDVSQGSQLKFINHSCNFNCEVDEDESGNLVLISAREINYGEELTIDYGYEEIYDDCSCKKCNERIYE